jgi:transcriptional regulator with XRE-family HTH domain
MPRIKGPPRPPHPVYQQLRDRRIAMNMSQEDVSRKIGYSLRMVQAWESGESIPKAPSLFDWINGLGGDFRLDFPD